VVPYVQRWTVCEVAEVRWGGPYLLRELDHKLVGVRVVRAVPPRGFGSACCRGHGRGCSRRLGGRRGSFGQLRCSPWVWDPLLGNLLAHNYQGHPHLLAGAVDHCLTHGARFGRRSRDCDVGLGDVGGQFEAMACPSYEMAHDDLWSHSVQSALGGLSGSGVEDDGEREGGGFDDAAPPVVFEVAENMGHIALAWLCGCNTPTAWPGCACRTGAFRPLWG
jgi:hypothetical protein